MKRRTLMMLSLLGIPMRSWAQDAPRRSRVTPPRARTVSESDGEADDRDPGPGTGRAKAARAKPRAEADDEPAAKHDQAAEGGEGSESDYHCKTFPISRYTELSPAASNPQTAIIDWIFRRTKTAPWHGDREAVLFANRTQLKACNTAKVIEQVEKVVEQFVEATANVLSVRVRFIAAADPQWRYAAFARLNAIGNGPQGQQIWHTTAAEVESIIAQMQVWQGFKLLEDTKKDVLNGQTLYVERFLKRTYPGGMQRDGAVGQGYQPKVDAIQEGISLRFSPLLSYEGDTLDAAVELSSNVIRKFHTVRVLGPKEVGTGDVSIEVPEVSETRLNQTINSWPLGQAIVISAGVQPGILMEKGGLWNLKIPGTTPTSTEALVVINVDVANRNVASAADMNATPNRPSRTLGNRKTPQPDE